MRRCVSLEIDAPGDERLLDIARGNFGPEHEDLFQETLAAIKEATDVENRPPGQQGISVAEYVDTVRAALALKSDEALREHLDQIIKKTVWKEQQRAGMR